MCTREPHQDRDLRRKPICSPGSTNPKIPCWQLCGTGETNINGTALTRRIPYLHLKRQLQHIFTKTKFSKRYVKAGRSQRRSFIGNMQGFGLSKTVASIRLNHSINCKGTKITVPTVPKQHSEAKPLPSAAPLCLTQPGPSAHDADVTRTSHLKTTLHATCIVLATTKIIRHGSLRILVSQARRTRALGIASRHHKPTVEEARALMQDHAGACSTPRFVDQPQE